MQPVQLSKSILPQIEASYAQLTRSEQRIANYFLRTWQHGGGR